MNVNQGKSHDDIVQIFLMLEKWKCQSLSHVQLFVTPWSIAYQAPLSIYFSRQECWIRLPFSFWDLPSPGIEPMSPALQANSLPTQPPGRSFLTLTSVLFTVLLNTERGIFKSYTIIVDLFISPKSFAFNSCILKLCYQIHAHFGIIVLSKLTLLSL